MQRPAIIVSGAVGEAFAIALMEMFAARAAFAWLARPARNVAGALVVVTRITRRPPSRFTPPPP